MSEGKVAAVLSLIAVGMIATTVTVFSSAYIVDEGNVAVITRMGQAIGQESPSGLRFKTPFVVGVREFDVRERASGDVLSASTSNQLSTQVSYSVNWRPDPAAVMEIFIKYGSPEEFFLNTIKPRLTQSLKASIGQFTGVQLVRNRDEVASTMLINAQQSLEDYPVILSSVQLENFELPSRYLEAVIQKEEQREATERESLALEQQRIKAQQNVQTAQAEAEATRALAEASAFAIEVEARAEAESIRMRSQAEAEGIQKIQEALTSNSQLIEYEKAKRWDGKLPSMILGESPNLMMSLP